MFDFASWGYGLWDGDGAASFSNGLLYSCARFQCVNPMPTLLRWQRGVQGLRVSGKAPWAGSGAQAAPVLSGPCLLPCPWAELCELSQLAQTGCSAGLQMSLMLVAVPRPELCTIPDLVRQVPVFRHTELTMHSWHLKTLLLG